MSLYHEAEQFRETIISNRHHLHQIPELGLNLPLTAAFVEEKLREMGYEPKRVGECGVVALAGKGEGKCFLIRADMDALPVVEDADIDFKSTNGNMHACGHDCHAAMLLGAAQLLKNHEDEIEGTVKLMFQPAEETMEGAKMMLAEGILENPHVDAAMGAHVFTSMPMPVGSVALMGAKMRMAGSDWFTIHITGKGCHGAMPNTGVDPLNVMSHIHIALQAINARELDPMDNLVLTVGQMHGGQTSNVIPNDAFMSGTIRTLKNETRAMVKARMEALVASIATAFGAEARVEWGAGCPVLIQNEQLYKEAGSYLKALDGITFIDLDEIGFSGASSGMGSEDFAYVSNEVPAVFLGVPAGTPQEGYIYPQHHPKARFQDKMLPYGAAAYAQVAMQWLKNHK